MRSLRGLKFRNVKVDKIPCSVEILTRNSEETLERCLESVRYFAEIIILDGNSTDGTLDIARRYGARIFKQYDTDEPLVRITNFSEVRNKGLRLAECDWFMYIDSDEYLSPEAVREIRSIVKNPHLPVRVFWQPRKYVLGGKIIECATTYPNRQIRFFHKDAVYEFIKQVHERIEIREDEKIGVLRGYEYVPRESLEGLRSRWTRYTQLEENMASGVLPQKRIRLVFRHFTLFFLYALRYSRNLLFCRGPRMPLSYEWAQHKHLLLFAAKLFKKLL